MGIEYRLRFKAPNSGAVAAELARLQGAKQSEKEPEALEFHTTRTGSEDLPDATARVEQGGLYFCDHGGDGRSFLGHVLARLTSSFGPVEVEEL
jgi:hypothetical protein